MNVDAEKNCIDDNFKPTQTVVGNAATCKFSELGNSDDGHHESEAKNASKHVPSITTETTNSEQEVVCEKWTLFTERLHRTIVGFVVFLSSIAVRSPKTCIASTVLISFALIAIGFATNFHVNVEETELYGPIGSLPREYQKWLKEESGFTDSIRTAFLILHNNGENVLGREQVRKVFSVIDTVRNTTGYNENCQDGAFWDDYKEEYTCRIVSATRAWYHDQALFESQVQSEQDLIDTLSLTEYPGGVLVDHAFVMGNLEYTDGNTSISYIPAYFVTILLADKGDETLDLEARVIKRLLSIREEWNRDDSRLHLDFYTDRSFSDEFERAIERDMYLVPIIAVVMSGFICIVFIKRDRVQSRCSLGVGSIFTITMSLFSGFGILFICGVPFTSMTQLLPFILYGVGLDDTFIITGAYLRMDPSIEPEERIKGTMQEVGSSITVTSVTTMAAFLLGLLSSTPAIYWMCLYAFPTVLIDYIFQITLFVAILILDERRIRANRKDCCVCCIVSDRNDEDESQSVNVSDSKEVKHMADRAMAWYGDHLMHPFVKAVVLVAFAVFFSICTFQTTMLTQEFDAKELLPDGSYASGALVAMDIYQDKTFPVSITFRDVNQSDPVIQQQMVQFIEEISDMRAFGEDPPFCWVLDFQKLKETEHYNAVAGLTFQQQVDYALSNPSLREVYGDDIVLDEDGNIHASRCQIYITNRYMDYVDDIIDLVTTTKEITNDQPINDDGRERDAFFAYSRLFLVFEFYSIAVDELIMTTVTSVVAVNIVAFIFIPHWTAVLFIFPLISIIYIDLMGILHMAGLHINAVTYVCSVISIGLIVDYIFHILLRYNELTETTREGRVKDTLVTMGSSILLGGLSTFLGALPLVFSTSTILSTVFTCFFSMVVLGASHGLILLPVLLSIVGPIPRPKAATETSAPPKEEKTSTFSSDSSSDTTPKPMQTQSPFPFLSLPSFDSEVTV